MVQSKADRERQKLITDKCQSLIEVLLKDEDNKYCVDCDAKGPRWASWNLGVFLCIRCAGIHRNLGVHISKVKSVNLDAWTPEHVAYVQRMGNSRSRAIFEANLPDDFRRPQTDTALESFIRAKYEHRKYIAQDYVDPGPPEPAFNIEDELKRIKEQKRNKLSSGTARMVTVTELPSTNPKPRPQATTTPQQSQLDLSLSSGKNSVGNSAKSSSKIATTTNNSNNNKTNNSALADLLDLDMGFSTVPASVASPINFNQSMGFNQSPIISPMLGTQLLATSPTVAATTTNANTSSSAATESLFSFATELTPAAPVASTPLATPMSLTTTTGTTTTTTNNSTSNISKEVLGDKNVLDLFFS